MLYEFSYKNEDLYCSLFQQATVAAAAARQRHDASRRVGSAKIGKQIATVTLICKCNIPHLNRKVKVESLKTKMTTFETREIIHQRNRGYQCQLPNRGVTYKPMHII